MFAALTVETAAMLYFPSRIRPHMPPGGYLFFSATDAVARVFCVCACVRGVMKKRWFVLALAAAVLAVSFYAGSLYAAAGYCAECGIVCL